MIVRRALEEPIRQIVENAGLEGSVIVEKVKSRDRRDPRLRRRIAMEYVDMMQAGIIDPTRSSGWRCRTRRRSRRCC